MVIYRTISFLAFFRTVMYRLLILFAAGAALLHFDENPVVISVLLGIAVITQLLMGNDYMVVYADRFVYAEGTLVRLFPKKVYHYKDLKSVTCSGTFTQFDDFGSHSHRSYRCNQLTIVFCDGTEKTIDTQIYKNHLLEAVQSIQQQMRVDAKQKA